MKRYFAGVDLGGTFIKCGLFTEGGKLVGKKTVPTGRERAYGEIAADAASAIRALASEQDISLSEVSAAGMGAPGTVDSARGVVIYSNNIAWSNVPIGEAVASRLSMPVFLTNDANAAALGESAFGAGKAYRSVVFLTLGTGVGGGVVIDGKLFEGGMSAGAELGHTVIVKGGRKCTCGRQGCLEAYASATALIESTRRAMCAHPESLLWQIAKDPDCVDGKTAFDGLRAGDKTAKRVVSGYLSHLATGIVDFANIFRPEAVLLGGGLSREGETLLAPLRRILARELYGGMGYAPVLLAAATLAGDAGLYGAAAYAMRRLQA